MANLQLFKTQRGALVPAANARNEAGGRAYALDPAQALAQYAATGCLSNTFYAGAQTQLDTVLELCAKVSPEAIAKTAVYCRERGYMKDMPALLAAVLASRAPELLAPVFGRVIDNGKMLRNFVQIMRSSVTGRKSLGSRPKKLVQQWLNSASEKELLAASVGNAPSLADVVKMVHPKPAEAWREALFAWLIGKAVDEAALPPVLRAFQQYKRDRSGEVPEVPFQMLTALELNRYDWAIIARQGGWHMVRMNLNTFARHGAFEVPGMAEAVARKLSDAEAIAKARVFPYQLLSAFMAADAAVPSAVSEALQDAMELSTANVPSFEGSVVVCPDVSGSMGSAVTGYRPGATSFVRCIDVAALVAACVLRKNRDARVLPFEQHVVDVKLNPRDSVMSNARALAAIGGGGTNCAAPLAQLNREKANADLVIYVSDNESWAGQARGAGTATMQEWTAFKARNPRAKLVCIDIQPNATTQAPDRDDVLNVGGFSDEVFKIVAAFAAGQMDAGHWKRVIDGTVL
jgi:60 kDa SS-A/Ro ribonucleoprotein